MKEDEDEDEEQLLREVTLQGAKSIFIARQRAEEEILRAREALSKQSELLRVTLASIGDAVITTDTEGRVLSLNAMAESLTGWTQQEAQGRSLTEVFRIVDEESLLQVENPAERALQEGRVVGLANHTILIARDGAQTPIDDSAAPILDDQGRIHGVVLIFRSIAERRQAEKILSQSERELADFFENASVGLRWVGPDGVILRVNQAELDMLGYSREEYVGRHIAEFHVDQDVIADILRRQSTGETIRDFEARMRRKDGSIKHVLIDSSVKWGEDGQFIHTRCFTRDVTDRKRAEEAQARLAAIIESSQDAIISKTLEGRIVSWNTGAEQIFGYSAEEVIGQPITLLIPPERYDEERMILERLRCGERFEHYETVRITKRGARIDVSLTISPVRDSDGRIIGASKISRDITARKRVEQRMATQHDVTHTLAEAAHLYEAAPKILQVICERMKWQVGALWRIDEQENALRCVEDYHLPYAKVPQFGSESRTRVFERGVGLPGRVWASGKAVWIGDVVEDKNFPRAAVASVEGIHSAFAFPIKLNDEVLGVMEFFTYEIRQPEPGLLEMMTAIGSQIGQFIERKRAEEARQALTHQLSAELADSQRLQEISSELIREGDVNALYQRLLDAAMGIMKSDMATLQIMDEGEDAMRMLSYRGFDPDFARMFALIRPDSMAPYDVARRTGHRVIVPDALICNFMADSPELGHHLQAGVRAVQSTPLFSRDGRMLGVISTHWRAPHQPTERDLGLLDVLARQAADLIERNTKDEALRQSLEREQAARAEAEQANRLKDEFLATLSHELRNPLNNIVGYAEVLLQTTEANRTYLVHQASEAILRNAQAQAQLVNDLLDLARLQTHKLAVERRPISLAPVVGDAVEMARIRAEEKKIKLDVDIEAEPLVVNADQLRVQQIVWNLVENALKFTPRGGRVAVRLSREGLDARLIVEDTGQGIDPEFTPNIFEMFRQADTGTSRAKEGLGIGLALVRQLVELHEGRVEAYSEGLGQGARFTVRLPLHSAPAEASAKASATSAPEALTGVRILLVDDTQDSVDMLRLLLTGKGAAVETALSGEEGLKTAENSEFDLVISDISMPGMDGYAFLQNLKETPRFETTPAIAITGFGRSEDVEEARKAGFTAHITKPIDFTDLVNIVRLIIWK